MDKTNVMRLLAAKNIKYIEKTYSEEISDGESIARCLNEDPDCVFKTLITENDKREHYVFCVPVNKELDLKKAAKEVGCKSIVMIKQKELLPLTGYIHGGCSPIGLKKQFPVFIDETAQLFDLIYVSGGRRGYQVGLNPDDLINLVSGKYADLEKN
ncbi:MAG TPA: Cys-tRNA(Pro) deacylase [Firmicutes bacterium]|nr:Cys-tRNA(Pro) deacylase [Bacillota bacterium]HBM70857.1 Cys-tRNA(Pro) deacylase [Bacillota bacterium]HBX25645.1 Cys-tRNA(Pro) deacylase [Bacillota bacterium]